MSQDIKSSIGSLIGQTGRLIGNLLDNNFRKSGFDITTEQWVILLNLYETDNLSQKELASIVFKNKASITSVLNQLEKKDLIKRVPNTKDKRQNYIRLTPQAKQIKKRLFSIANQTIADFTGTISDREILSCSLVLKKIIGNTKKLV